MMDYLFLVLLFIVAALYASIGHGGASGYLALMAIFGFEQYFMKSSALTLNIFVSGISFFSFYRKGYMKFNVLRPFVIGSIPMAFIGAQIQINAESYKIILGVLLLFAVMRMFFSPKNKFEKSKQPNFYIAVLIGAAIGLFSGMIGIGGGIILSPVILLLGWAGIKETAGISALFILLNSVSGLIGLFFNDSFEPSNQIFLWVVVGLMGGFTGAYISSTRLSTVKLKYLLTQVLFLASLKLLFF